MQEKWFFEASERSCMRKMNTYVIFSVIRAQIKRKGKKLFCLKQVFVSVKMGTYVLTNYSWLMMVTHQLNLLTPAVQVPKRLLWFCGYKFGFFSYLSSNQNKNKNHKQTKKKKPNQKQNQMQQIKGQQISRVSKFPQKC